VSPTFSAAAAKLPHCAMHTKVRKARIVAMITVDNF